MSLCKRFKFVQNVSNSTLLIIVDCLNKMMWWYYRKIHPFSFLSCCNYAALAVGRAIHCGFLGVSVLFFFIRVNGYVIFKLASIIWSIIHVTLRYFNLAHVLIIVMIKDSHFISCYKQFNIFEYFEVRCFCFSPVLNKHHCSIQLL